MNNAATHVSGSVSDTLVPITGHRCVSSCLSLVLESTLPWPTSRFFSQCSGARLICSGSDSMLRCSPDRRGYSSGEELPLLVSNEETCRDPKPDPEVEKQAEEETVRSGAGLGVRWEPEEEEEEEETVLLRSWSFE